MSLPKGKASAVTTARSLSTLLILLLAFGSGSMALAGGSTPVCLLLHPSGGPVIKVDPQDTCGSVRALITYRPKGKSKERQVVMEGSGAGITVDTDSYCLINLHNDDGGVLMATARLELHVGKRADKASYRGVVYDLSFLNFRPCTMSATRAARTFSAAIRKPVPGPGGP